MLAYVGGVLGRVDCVLCRVLSCVLCCVGTVRTVGRVRETAVWCFESRNRTF